MNPPLFSFNVPCLNWKLILAIKDQWGFPGFQPPYATRYLNMLVEQSFTPAFGYGTDAQSPATVRQQLWTYDRLTGERTPHNSSNAATDFATFPYGVTLSENPAKSETWEVRGDTFYRHFFKDDYYANEYKVTLSNPYDISTLEADADTLLASVDIDKVPWRTMKLVGTDLFGDDPSVALPAQVTYGSLRDQDIPQLNAAAWYIHTRGGVNANVWRPNIYSKMIGIVRMAGNYCEKTFWLDRDTGTQINAGCESGHGSCALPFKVLPPPYVPGQNAYVQIIPNCQCGGVSD